MNEIASGDATFGSDDGDPSGSAAPISGLQEAALASAAAGDLHKALYYGTQLLAALGETLGEQHPDTLAVAVLIAGWQLNTGDVSGALAAIRQLIPTVTQVLGPDDPSTLTARHTLACGDSALGVTPAEALPVWVALYGDEQRVFGAEHHSTLAARHQIGELRRQLGDRIGARDELIAAAQGIRKVLGDQHVDSVAIQLTAAVCLGEAGDAAAAVVEFERLIPLLTTMLGYDHQHTLLARHTRALWLPEPTSGWGDLLDRVSDWEVLVDDEARALGEHNQLTVAGRATLAEQRTAWRERLDESANETVADKVSELRDEMAGWMDVVVNAKKSVAQVIRESGQLSGKCLRERLDLAHTLWLDHNFGAAGAWAEPLVAECSSFLGDDHALTQAARALLRTIEGRQF